MFCKKILALSEISFERVIDVAVSEIPRDLLNSARSRVSGGIRILEHSSELNDYLVAFGHIHQSKLLEFLPHIQFERFADSGLTLVDWGCGQGLATVVTLDYLKKLGLLQFVRCIRLVEISSAALNRAKMIIEKYLPHVDIQTFSWNLHEINRVGLSVPKNIPILHLFSNILDVCAIDLEGVQKTVQLCSAGHTSLVLSVGPDREKPYSSPLRLADFYKMFNGAKMLHQYAGGINLHSKYWPWDYCKCYGFLYELIDDELQQTPATIPLLPNDMPEDIFMYSACGMYDEVVALMNNGLDVNIQNEKGETALIIATYYGEKEIVKLLLEHNAQVDIQATTGATALYWAAKHGDVECVKILLAAGANTELSIFSTQYTPFLIAVKYQRVNVLQELIRYKCNIEVCDSRGRNAEDLIDVYDLKSANLGLLERGEA